MGREEHCKQISLAYEGSACSVSATLGLPPPMACVLSQSTLLSLQVALHVNCLKQALACVHVPGLHHSGSGSQVLPKGADSVGPVFSALPRSEQLRRPGAWRALSPQVGSLSYHLPGPRHSVSWVAVGVPFSSVPYVSSGELISGCNPPGRCQLFRIPESMVLAQRQKYRSMEQNRRPRDKSTHLWTPYLLQRRQEYTMEKRQSL